MKWLALLALVVVAGLVVLVVLYEPAEYPHRKPMDWESFGVGFLCATLIMPLLIQLLRDCTIGGAS